jgi:hypothetical protein
VIWSVKEVSLIFYYLTFSRNSWHLVSFKIQFLYVFNKTNKYLFKMAIKTQRYSR